MAVNRYDELKGALYEHIREKKFVDDRALLTCLVSRLNEWVDRLDPGAFSRGRIEQTDFLDGLMVSIEVIDEVKSASGFNDRFPEREWREFKNAVTWLEQTREHEDISLVERTYRTFKDRFTAISEKNSDHDNEPRTRIDSNPSRTNERQSANQGGPPEIELDGPTHVEWWPRSDLLSPTELRTSRVILSLAMLLLLGSFFLFVDFVYDTIMDQAHFGALEGFGGSWGDVTRNIGNLAGCFFCCPFFFLRYGQSIG
jgi:hypothetical protein